MLMNTLNRSKNISSLDTEQDTAMGPFEDDSKDLGIIEKLSFCKASTFFFARLPLFY